MALVKIYDANGVEFEKETVDARECVALGMFTYEPEVKVKTREKAKAESSADVVPVAVESAKPLKSLS